MLILNDSEFPNVAVISFFVSYECFLYLKGVTLCCLATKTYEYLLKLDRPTLNSLYGLVGANWAV